MTSRNLPGSSLIWICLRRIAAGWGSGVGLCGGWVSAGCSIRWRLYGWVDHWQHANLRRVRIGVANILRDREFVFIAGAPETFMSLGRRLGWDGLRVEPTVSRAGCGAHGQLHIFSYDSLGHREIGNRRRNNNGSGDRQLLEPRARRVRFFPGVLLF